MGSMLPQTAKMQVRFKVCLNFCWWPSIGESSPEWFIAKVCWAGVPTCLHVELCCAMHMTALVWQTCPCTDSHCAASWHCTLAAGVQALQAALCHQLSTLLTILPHY